jgi:hypothetical protein
MGRAVNPARRRSFVFAALATITGGGVGHQLGETGLGLMPGVGVWIALLGMGGLFALFLSTPDGSGETVVATDDAGWTEFRRELRRSRRGGRPLTLLRIAGEELPTNGPDGAGDLATRSRRLALHLRLVDRTWVDDGSIYVLLPESPRSAADILVSRIRVDSPGQLPEFVRVASFPEDGLTSGAIIAAVNGGAVDAVPIPIRPTLGDVGEVAAFAMDEELAVGEAVRT